MAPPTANHLRAHRLADLLLSLGNLTRAYALGKGTFALPSEDYTRILHNVCADLDRTVRVAQGKPERYISFPGEGV